MDVKRRFALSVALMALALGMTAGSVRAESVLKGTFELPAAAYLGNTLLQPGQYTIWTSAEIHALEHVPVLHVSGEGITTTFMAVARPDENSGRNFLEVMNIDGTYVVRAFDAGSIGKTFAIGVTKSVKQMALRASAQPIMTIPVSSGAGF
jgi:hypothetical protein